MTAEREGLAEIAGVLAEHVGRPFVCACGEMTETADAHRAHLADALADLLAARDRRVRAEALREAADAVDAKSERIGGMYAGDCTELLRDRADRIEADR